MTFTAPLWLLALLPWVGVVVWMFAGRHAQTQVPFLALWGKTNPAPKPRASLHLPPLAVVCMLLAMLLAILGAAGPVLSFGRSSNADPITIILDRGATMSAGDRWRKLLPELATAINTRFGDGPVELIPVPDGKVLETNRRGWAILASALDPTVIDTLHSLQVAVTGALQRTDGPVFVISDQVVQRSDLRIVRVSPSTQPSNVGIVSAAASRSPGPQVMLRIRNDSALTHGELRAGNVTQTIDLPPRGTERLVFVGLPAIPEALPIELHVADDLTADNRGTLRQAHARPRLEPSGVLPAAVQRVISSYTKARPPGSGSSPLRISATPLEPATAGIHVAAADQPAPDGQLLLADHPINARVNWSELPRNETRIAPRPIGDGWTPIVRVGDRPLVAVRDTPARQVWVGFDSESFPRTPAFVVFWTNALDYAGRGGDVFVFEGAAAVPVPPGISSDWQSQLASLPPALGGGLPVGSWLLLAAELLAFLGVLRWDHLQ